MREEQHDSRLFGLHKSELHIGSANSLMRLSVELATLLRAILNIATVKAWYMLIRLFSASCTLFFPSAYLNQTSSQGLKVTRSYWSKCIQYHYKARSMMMTVMTYLFWISFRPSCKIPLYFSFLARRSSGSLPCPSWTEETMIDCFCGATWTEL